MKELINEEKRIEKKEYKEKMSLAVRSTYTRKG